jgi:hypothetical protein
MWLDAKTFPPAAAQSGLSLVQYHFDSRQGS